MTPEQFQKHYDSIIQKEREILSGKGKEYTRGTLDRFSNFERMANDLQISPLKVLGIFLNKHLDSIYTYIQKGQTFCDESIHGRIHDARNYLALLDGMITEREQNIPRPPETFGSAF